MPDEFNQNRANQEPTVPSPQPIYSTSDYAGRHPYAAPPPPPNERNSAARERAKKRRIHGGTTQRAEWAWVVVAATLFAVVIVISVGATVFVQASQTELEIIPTADVAALPTPIVAYSDFSDQIQLSEALILPDGSSVELVPWDGESRFTMILAGLDRRPGETGLAYRTDSMMLISLDPVNDAIGVLSIPRDLYVQIPGYGSLQRINTPMVYGENRSAGTGPQLLMQTVQLNLGIRVNDYLLVDFQAFIDLVDAIGGVTINNERTINDPRYPSMNYGYDPFFLAAGVHQLNGYDTLRYARTRHGDSDISRAERQQQVLYAVRDKVLDLNMLPTLIAQSPSLWASLQDNVYTGLSLEQILQLGLYVRDVPRENITMDVIDFSYLQSYTTGSGAQVLVPNRARIGTLMLEVFGPNYNQ